MRIDGAMNVIDFGSRRITYNLHREDRKRLRIIVAPELTFYSLLTRCQPDWRNRKEILDNVVI